MERLGVTNGGEAPGTLNATDFAAAPHRALRAAPTFTARQRPQTD